MRSDDNGKYVWAEPKPMVRLSEMGVVNTDEFLTTVALKHDPNRITTDLVSQISTQSVAKWACTAASGIVNAVLDVTPFVLAPRLELLYRESFMIPADF